MIQMDVYSDGRRGKIMNWSSVAAGFIAEQQAGTLCWSTRSTRRDPRQLLQGHRTRICTSGIPLIRLYDED